MTLNIKNTLLASSLVLVLGCAPDEKQTVTTMNQLVKQDEFNVDGAPDSSMWSYDIGTGNNCLLYTSPSPRDYAASRMPSSA